MKRYAGVLLPVTSLPSRYGIGCFDQAAYDFVDWLQKAGQRYWQILPLGATSYGSSDDSPYQVYSAFAGNPYLISLDALVGGEAAPEPPKPRAPLPETLFLAPLDPQQVRKLRKAGVILLGMTLIPLLSGLFS